MATDVGLAVDKNDPVFRDWLQAVYDEVKDQGHERRAAHPEGRLTRPEVTGGGPQPASTAVTDQPPMNINLQPIADSWPFLLKALGMTLFISVLSMLFGFAIGVVVGGLRTYGGRVARIDARLLRRYDAGDPAARRAGLDLLRLSAAHRPLASTP